MLQVPKITVIGSANIDLVIQADRFPQPGETMLGNAFNQFMGGKGANQAVAASRLGADVTFIGCVGDDLYGENVKANLQKEKVNIEHVVTVQDTTTGLANILVAENDNVITVIPGANYRLTYDHVVELEETIATSDAIVLQLEILLDTVEKAVELAHKHDVPIILDPAPAAKLSDHLLSKVNYITPNETEMKMLSVTQTNDHAKQFQKMFSIGVKHVIMTRGAEGVIYGNKEQQTMENYDAFQVNVVDTTGAGDTFCAAFSVAIAKGKLISEAIHFATAAASLSTTKLGAQIGMPTEEEVEQFMQANKTAH